jgi:hypothetical protein
MASALAVLNELTDFSGTDEVGELIQYGDLLKF